MEMLQTFLGTWTLETQLIFQINSFLLFHFTFDFSFIHILVIRLEATLSNKVTIIPTCEQLRCDSSKLRCSVNTDPCVVVDNISPSTQEAEVGEQVPCEFEGKSGLWVARKLRLCREALFQNNNNNNCCQYKMHNVLPRHWKTSMLAYINTTN